MTTRVFSLPEAILNTLVILALDSLRSGRNLTDDEAAALDRLPVIDKLRKEVVRSDAAWLIPLVASASEVSAGLASSLLRHHINAPAVAQCMIDRWQSASPYLKNRLMWRLLEYEELPAEWHDHFLEFVIANRNVFDAFNRDFYGESETALSRNQARLEDESFPAQKKWIYWLCIPGITPDRKQWIELLQEGIAKGDDRTRRAISKYLEHFEGRRSESDGYKAGETPAPGRAIKKRLDHL